MSGWCGARSLGYYGAAAMAVVLGAVVATVVVRPASSTLSSSPRQWRAGVTAPAMASPTKATLVTNEYAYHHPDSADAVRSPDWIVTSGSLFAVGGLLWSGHPDDRSPGPTSTGGTDSAVLRVVTTRTDYADVRLTFGLWIAGLTETKRTPSKDTDGVHAILRYQSEFSTYYVSMFRRDGQVAVKKKVAGGPSNGGTYHTLGAKPFPIDPAWRGSWHQVETTVERVPPGNVQLTLRIDGRAAIDVIDGGAGGASGAGAPVGQAAGRVGLRGDNCEFFVRDFTVAPLPRQ